MKDGKIWWNACTYDIGVRGCRDIENKENTYYCDCETHLCNKQPKKKIQEIPIGGSVAKPTRNMDHVNAFVITYDITTF